MSLSGSNINSLNSLMNNKESISGIVSDPSSAINSPITGVIIKNLFKINDLISNIENKIIKLQEDFVSNSDNSGTVKLINNVIVITVKPEDVSVANLKQQKILQNINSINKTLVILQNTISVLNIVNNTIKTLFIALDTQEKILNTNPTSKASFLVFKKAIKIVFLKEIFKEQSKVLNDQLNSNKNKLNELINRFSSLSVQIKISDQKNEGKFISEEQASELIIDDLLDNNDLKISQYIDSQGFEYIFKVEKYGVKQLIGRAYEKKSNSLKVQTSPSFISTSQELYNELENILENKQ